MSNHHRPEVQVENGKNWSFVDLCQTNFVYVHRCIYIVVRSLRFNGTLPGWMGDVQCAKKGTSNCALSPQELNLSAVIQ